MIHQDSKGGRDVNVYTIGPSGHYGHNRSSCTDPPYEAVTAAALEAAAIVRNRRKPGSTTPEANADDVAPGLSIRGRGGDLPGTDVRTLVSGRLAAVRVC